jgi:uncharacterized protein YbaP (TraB family)
MPELAAKNTPDMSGGSTLFMRASGVATLLAGLILVAGRVTAAADSLMTAGVEPSDDYRKGLLWRIAPPDRPPSYLFGTMHSEHADVVDVPDPVKAAFAQSDRIILEMRLDHRTLGKVAEAMQIEAGPGLPALVGPQLFEQAAQIMNALGIPSEVLKGMKPWAVAITLLMPRTDTGLFLDRVLYLEALAKNKHLYGLETAEEQMAVFDGLSLKEQINLLHESLALVPQLDALYAQMRKAYAARDLTALAGLNELMLEKADPALAEVVTRRLVTERNRRMADRLEAYLDQGNSFVAIGALHLPGADGVLSLLAARGYGVEVVY